MKIISKLNKYIKLTVLLIAVLILVGTTNGNQYKVKNSNLNLYTDLTLMALKVEKDIQNDIYSAKETYEGDLTGYGADCPLCGGHLACMPSLDVLHGNVTYSDSTYGTLRIVASSQNLPCGSVVRFDFPSISSDGVLAIVLDRGVVGTSLDLLVESNNAAYTQVGRRRITYDVVRKGW